MADAPKNRFRRLVLWISAALTTNLLRKFLSLLLACGLWLFVNFGERDTEEALKVPLEMRNIPGRLVITSPRIDFIDLRVAGPRTLLGRIDHNQLSLPFDLTGARPGPAVFNINTDRLGLPRGVRVVRITPAQVTVTLEQVRRKLVPVNLRLAGEPPEDFRVVAAMVKPKEVEISGPASQVNPIESVATEELRLDGQSYSNIAKDLPLEPLGESVTHKPSTVAVEIQIEEIVTTRTIAKAPIEVVNAALPFQVEPPSVSLTLRGPRRVLEPLDPNTPMVQLDASGLASGSHRRSVLLTPPDEVEVVEVDPKRVQIMLIEPTPTPTEASQPQRAPTAARPRKAVNP